MKCCISKWEWMMEYCRKNNIPPAQPWAWERAEREYFEWLKRQIQSKRQGKVKMNDYRVEKTIDLFMQMNEFICKKGGTKITWEEAKSKSLAEFLMLLAPNVENHECFNVTEHKKVKTTANFDEERESFNTRNSGICHGGVVI